VPRLARAGTDARCSHPESTAGKGLLIFPEGLRGYPLPWPGGGNISGQRCGRSGRSGAPYSRRPLREHTAAVWIWALGLTTVPDSIRQLTALTELHLYGERLTTVPDWIGQLTTLTELSLSGNRRIEYRGATAAEQLPFGSSASIHRSLTMTCRRPHRRRDARFQIPSLEGTVSSPTFQANSKKRIYSRCYISRQKPTHPAVCFAFINSGGTNQWLDEYHQRQGRSVRSARYPYPTYRGAGHIISRACRCARRMNCSEVQTSRHVLYNVRRLNHFQ
jgi:hypothetical protein